MTDMTSEDKKELYRQMDRINASLSRVLFILENDDKTNQTGLVDKVYKNTKELELIRREKDVIYAKASAWGAIGAILMMIFGWFINILVAYFLKQ